MGRFGSVLSEVIEQSRRGADEATVVRPGQVAPEVDDVVRQAPEVDDVARAPEEPSASAVEPDDAARAPEESPVAPDEPTGVELQQQIDIDQAAIAQEAMTMSQRRLDDFALDESFQTNFNTIETTDQVKVVLADVAQQNAGRIDEARRGVITNEQLTGLAQDLDIDEQVVRQIMERETGGVVNAETILAARQVLNSSAERIHSLAVRITRGEATDLDRLTFRRQMQWHREFQIGFMGARAEAGRLLNALRIPTGADEVDLGRIRELMDAADGHNTNDVAAAIALMDNTTAITQASRRYTQSRIMGVVNENFVNSILSGPKTHIINTAGNIMMQAMGITETAIAARIGRFLPGPDHVRVGEASALIHGTLGAWRDALTLAARTMRTGVALDDVVKFESTRRRSISAEHLLTAEQRATPLGRFAEGLLDGVRIPIPGTERSIPIPGIGPIIRAPTERVMAPVDEFFKTLAYRAELQRQTFTEVAERVQAGTLRSDEVAAVTRELMESPTPGMVRAADDYTRYVTFQNPLGDIGQKAQLLIRSAPALSILAPFIRTPINIFKAGILQRSPLAVVSGKFRQAVRNGGRERDMALARISLGTATAATTAALTLDGTITGGGPGDSAARAILELSGWRPYSVRVENPITGEANYVSYARGEPIAFVIGAVADATEILSYINSDIEGMDDEQAQMNDALAAIVTGIAQNTMSKTYVQGIADFTEAMNDPGRYMASWMRNLGSAMIPYSAFRAQMGQLDDPFLREAWTMMDRIRIKSGIPGLSENAPPRRDVFGQPRLARAGGLFGAMSPFPSSQEIIDPTVDRLQSLMEATRQVPITMPMRRIEGMRLDAEEYDELIRISRIEPAPGSGRTFREELERVMESTIFMDATLDRQVELIRDTQGRYDQIARMTLEQRNETFAARLARYRQKRQELRFGDR